MSRYRYCPVCGASDFLVREASPGEGTGLVVVCGQSPDVCGAVYGLVTEPAGPR